MVIGFWKFWHNFKYKRGHFPVCVRVCVCVLEDSQLFILFFVLCPVRHWLGVSKDDTLMNPGRRIF